MLVGLVTVPTTVPPPITILPFTSILPVKFSLVPAEKTVDAAGVILFAAVILPFTKLLFASTIAPPLKRLVLLALIPAFIVPTDFINV